MAARLRATPRGGRRPPAGGVAPPRGSGPSPRACCQASGRVSAGAGDGAGAAGCEAGGASRRAVLAAGAAGGAAVWASSGTVTAVDANEWANRDVLSVPGDFRSISEAIQAAPPGGVVQVGSGLYRERLRLEASVTIEAAAGADVEVRHETETPYESVVDVSSPAPGATLRGIRLRHSSKSVAQNYAVLVREGAGLVLERCDVSSATGSGLGVEGGVVTAVDCVISGSKGYGAAVLGDLLGESPAESTLRGCTVERNGAGGILARAGARVALENNHVESNGGFGLELVGCVPGAVRGNTVRGNAAGSVAVAQGVPAAAAPPESNALDSPARAT